MIVVDEMHVADGASNPNGFPRSLTSPKFVLRLITLHLE